MLKTDRALLARYLDCKEINGLELLEKPRDKTCAAKSSSEVLRRVSAKGEETRGQRGQRSTLLFAKRVSSEFQRHYHT